MKTGHKHLHTLDTLRGIAALSVCLYHFTGAVLVKVPVPALAKMFGWGWAGVDIFFVISGFIIPYVLTIGDYRIRDFGQFIGKRFVRICPPSYIVVILMLVQWWVFDHVIHANHTYLTGVTPMQVVHNFTYTAPFANYEWIDSVFWTLAVEFQFYIMLGLVFRFTFKNIYTFAALCAVVIALFYVSPFGSLIPTDIHNPQKDAYFFKWGTIFLMGGLTTLYFVRRITLPQYLVVLGALSVVCYLQLGIIIASFSLATALLISFVHIKNRVGAFLGKISYSLYLVHILCAPIFEVALTKVIPIGSTAGKVTVQVLCVLLSIGFSYIFYLLVEKYWINVANKLFGKKKPAAMVPQPVVAPHETTGQ